MSKVLVDLEALEQVLATVQAVGEERAVLLEFANFAHKPDSPAWLIRNKARAVVERCTAGVRQAAAERCADLAAGGDALAELMRRCREDGHQVTYQDLVELQRGKGQQPGGAS